jgi:hypothetical protein
MAMTSGADGPAGGPQHNGGDDAEPGVVIGPGDDLAFAAIGQEQAGGDIELPVSQPREVSRILRP